MLHRIQDDSDSKKKLCAEGESKLEWIINNLWNRLAKELVGQDPHHFLRAYSPGIANSIYMCNIYFNRTRFSTFLGIKGMQEFIEAASFLHYIQQGTLITLDELQLKLTFANDLVVPIPVYEYLLGIADLTGEDLYISTRAPDFNNIFSSPIGELMRLCINAVGRGQSQLVSTTCSFLRKIHESLSSLKQVERKTNVQISQCLINILFCAVWAINAN